MRHGSRRGAPSPLPPLPICDETSDWRCYLLHLLHLLLLIDHLVVHLHLHLHPR